MTKQIPDRLRFNRRVHNLFTEPLESYFDDQHPKPKAFVAIGSSCWRGYVAAWCIKQGRLYLERLDPVFADWFSGELRYLPLKFYWGKVISECEALETASLMHVERGVLTYRNKNRS
jgi:hypothetical protein